MAEIDLNACRAEIDRIDAELCDLFVRRMTVAADIAAYKAKAGKPVLDASREAVVLDRAADRVGDRFAPYARALYKTLMALSRDYQASLIGGPGEADGPDKAHD